MATKTKAYVDTSALIAFLDSRDTYHHLFEQLFSDPPSLISTSLVITEGHGWFLRRYDSHRALQFLNFIEDLKPLTLVEVGANLIQEGTKIIRKYSDQSLTLVDACGLAVMKRLKIKSCWSTDRHLGLTKVPLIIYQ